MAAPMAEASHLPLPAASWTSGRIDAIAARWWLAPAGIAVALLLALLWLRQADYLYTATLRVSAAPASAGARPTQALGPLAALAGLGGAGEQVTPFRYYLDGLHAPEVAARLARDRALMRKVFPAEWDGTRWRRPAGLFSGLRRGVGDLLGLPDFGWSAPDARRLAEHIADAVAVRQSVKTPLATITYTHPDPAFAVLFLDRLDRAVDGWLREQQQARARANIVYLSGRLAAATLAEQRAALVAALAEQERQAMLSGAGTAYAADRFDDIIASPEPTRPRPMPLLAGAAVAGLLLGLLAAALAGGRRRQ
jgi:hypothetical protein